MMFYFLSKLFWLFFHPVNLFFLVLTVAVVLLGTRFARAGKRLLVAGLVGGLVLAHTPISQLLLEPLENRFPRPAAPSEVTGIISLGGGVEYFVAGARGVFEMESASDRIIETIRLARRYPKAKVIYSSGAPAIIFNDRIDASAIKNFIKSFEIAGDRIIIENKSRNTHENALFSLNMVQPQPHQTYLLVTSAFNMPRAIGVFRQAGWDVVPWPVDYRTTGKMELHRFFYDPVLYLGYASLATKEWIGLFVYWLTGRTPALLPGP